jgi:hypothetical protein
VIPELRGIVLHALPNVIEGKLIPVALFIVFLDLLGDLWALLITLAWALGAIAYRAATGRRVPGLLLFSAVALSARTIAALATGSMIVYFLQPTITTVLVGLAFMASVPLGVPLAQRLAYDVIPFDEATKQHPLVRSFFVRMSIVWALTSLANGAITLWLLLSSSTTTFVLVKSVLGPASAAVAIGVMLVWARLSLTRTGTTIVRARSNRAAGVGI